MPAHQKNRWPRSRKELPHALADQPLRFELTQNLPALTCTPGRLPGKSPSPAHRPFRTPGSPPKHRLGCQQINGSGKRLDSCPRPRVPKSAQYLRVHDSVPYFTLAIRSANDVVTVESILFSTVGDKVCASSAANPGPTETR